MEDNRHNHITACYHLIDRRNKKLKDRQESYQQTKIDFKKKMRMGTNIKDEAKDARGTTNHSPNPPVAGKQDLNMTAPINSEQIKHGRKVNEYVGSPIPNAGRKDNSLDYSTI